LRLLIIADGGSLDAYGPTSGQPSNSSASL
jgi:hypothetical protein